MTSLDLEALRDGRFFTVVFIKRTTGECRRMRARCGVKKHLKGGKPAYDFSERGLLPVYDLDKRQYRSVPIENIIELHHHGQVQFGPLADQNEEPQNA